MLLCPSEKKKEEEKPKVLIGRLIVAPRKGAVINLHRPVRKIAGSPVIVIPLAGPVSHRRLWTTALTFSVSRSFTVGNGVLVDILCASQAAPRCSELGRAEQTRGGPSGSAAPPAPLYIPCKHRKRRPFTAA